MTPNAAAGDRSRVGIVGLGLVGGSLARRLLADGLEVAGYDVDEQTRSLAAADGVLVRDGVGQVATTVDVLVLATPNRSTATVLDEVSALPAPPLVADVGAAKVELAAAAASRRWGDLRLVLTHPMAGRERSGYAAGSPDLFSGATWAFVVDAGTVVEDWMRVVRLVLRTGARVLPIGAEEHDRAVARVSHAAHAAAGALTRAALEPRLLPAALLAAGSFRDGTRVSAAEPAFTADMLGANAVEAAAAVAEVAGWLAALASSLRIGDDGAVEAFFAASHVAKERHLALELREEPAVLAAGAGGVDLVALAAASALIIGAERAEDGRHVLRVLRPTS